MLFAFVVPYLQCSVNILAVLGDDAHSAYSMEYARSYYNPTVGRKGTRNGREVFWTDNDTQIVGTYLTWKTATAGTGDTTNTSRPNDSICPAGWQLPVNDSNGKSYDNLIRKVYTNQPFSQGWASQNQNGAHIYATSQTLRQAPLSFPFSGLFYFYPGDFTSVARYGNFWSSTSYSAPGVYRLDFVSSYLRPQNITLKGYGMSVRCVAPKISAATIWGAETKAKHSSGTTNAKSIAYSMEYARSYYSPTIGSKETKNGNLHFLNDNDTQIVGTYLNWKTATAGTGDMTNISRPNDSVCPAGWQLPIRAGDKSYDQIIRKTYGSQITDGIASQNQNGARIYAINQTLRQAPLSFPFSGTFTHDTGNAGGIAGSSDYWSSSACNTSYACDLGIGSNYIYPQGYVAKGRGFPVRCVALKIFYHLGRRNWGET